MPKLFESPSRGKFSKKPEWQTKPVAELLLPQTTINPLLSPNKTFSYIDVSSVSTKTCTIQEPQIFLGKNAPSRARKVILKDDVIFATIRPTLKRVALIPEEFDNQICSTGYVVLRPKVTLHPRYLFYWLFTKSFSDEMASLQRGASYPAVSDADVRKQPIHFPCKAEQERIVAILDEAFEGIARANRNAEHNSLNAQSIFEECVKALITSEDLNWPIQTLGQICQVERGSSPRPIKSYFTTESDGVNWIKIGDTVEGETYIHTTKQKITPEGAKQSRFVQEGDFVLTNSMSFGRSYIMKTSGYIHDGWFVLRLKSSIDRDYLYYLLSSKYIRD